MTRFPIRSTLASAAAVLLSAAAVHATTPSPGNSIVPSIIRLVGTTGNVPAQSLGEFEVVFRDLANNPIPGASVVVDLSLCADLQVCADQRDANAIVDCANKRVSKITDGAGRVRMTLLGASNGAGNATTPINGGRIYANGTLIQSPTVVAFDLDGSFGVGGPDLSAWLGDFLAAPTTYGRSDYDNSGNIGGADLSVWLTVFRSATMTESCASSCP
jgi:hypothetical protein